MVHQIHGSRPVVELLEPGTCEKLSPAGLVCVIVICLVNHMLGLLSWYMYCTCTFLGTNDFCSLCNHTHLKCGRASTLLGVVTQPQTGFYHVDMALSDVVLKQPSTEPREHVVGPFRGLHTTNPPEATEQPTSALINDLVVWFCAFLSVSQSVQPFIHKACRQQGHLSLASQCRESINCFIFATGGRPREWPPYSQITSQSSWMWLRPRCRLLTSQTWVCIFCAQCPILQC